MAGMEELGQMVSQAVTLTAKSAEGHEGDDYYRKRVRALSAQMLETRDALQKKEELLRQVLTHCDCTTEDQLREKLRLFETAVAGKRCDFTRILQERSRQCVLEGSFRGRCQRRAFSEPPRGLLDGSYMTPSSSLDRTSRPGNDGALALDPTDDLEGKETQGLSASSKEPHEPAASSFGNAAGANAADFFGVNVPDHDVPSNGQEAPAGTDTAASPRRRQNRSCTQPAAPLALSSKKLLSTSEFATLHEQEDLGMRADFEDVHQALAEIESRLSAMRRHVMKIHSEHNEDPEQTRQLLDRIVRMMNACSESKASTTAKRLTPPSLAAPTKVAGPGESANRLGVGASGLARSFRKSVQIDGDDVSQELRRQQSKGRSGAKLASVVPVSSADSDTGPTKSPSSISMRSAPSASQEWVQQAAVGRDILGGEFRAASPCDARMEEAAEVWLGNGNNRKTAELKGIIGEASKGSKAPGRDSLNEQVDVSSANTMPASHLNEKAAKEAKRRTSLFPRMWH